jgi:catechol 2,3-dioxygenase-like lactoylglutathione lyase family enzyme
MAITLNHTIVPSHDKHASAAFIAEILGVPVGAETPPFVPVRLANDVTLDYMDSGDVVSQHYAFLLDDEEWDAAYQRILDRGVQTWADPDHHEPGGVNTRWGGRGVYFPDPNGHNMEIMTATPDQPKSGRG